MQNINSVYFVGPAVVLLACSILLLYWHRNRRLTMNALVYSLLAYGSAIAGKYIIQFFTLAGYTLTVNGSKIALGIYYGLQTAILEVGIALLVATLALRRGKLTEKDAEGYGLGLAFWENGVLLGIISLLNYIAYYIILSSATPQAETVYNVLISREPVLFYPLSKALPFVAYFVIERISSILLHFIWGLLAILAVVHKKNLIYPILFISGFIVDFLVPVSGSIGLQLTELLTFIVSASALGLGLLMAKSHQHEQYLKQQDGVSDGLSR
ncbi:MAG: YhfC family glutamic-type intramembrane protease [Conexivisphaerales archaeon]